MIEIGEADVGAALGETNCLGGSELAPATGDDCDAIGEGDGRWHGGEVSAVAVRIVSRGTVIERASTIAAAKRPDCRMNSFASLSEGTDELDHGSRASHPTHLRCRSIPVFRHST